ncbi:hypothetical protein J6P92_01205 [bacterium]|nr:hypothetical protein [bacterium]
MSEQNLDDYDFEHEKFMQETVKNYQAEIKKYTFEIKKGENSTFNYASLFQSYKALYEFTKDEKEYKCVDKETVENACTKLLAKIKDEMSQNINMADNYGYLSYVYEYKENLPKALECLDKAVELDTSNLITRASFKNHTLNDREGALEDYRKALENEQDPDQKEFIQHMIDTIDLIRDTDKEIKKFHLKTTLITLAIIAYIIYKIYVIFFVK